ncbi:MAG TPA: M12 family metallo-peptidase [Actinomycetota bacterium]
MKPFRWIVAVAVPLLFGAGLSVAGPVRSATALHPGTSAAVAAAAATGEPARVSVPGLGVVSLILRDNPLRAPGARATLTGADGIARDVLVPQARTLAGVVAGDPSSVVRLTLTSSGIGGFVATAGRRVWIEPDPIDPRRSIAHPDTAGEVEYGDDAIEVPHGAAVSHSGQVNALGVGSCSIESCGVLTAHVILDGDVHYRNLAADCFGRQMTVLNAVDGIYAASTTRIRLFVTQQNCRTTSDLGSTSTNAVTLLGNLRTAWTTEGANRSLVYLFSGYDLPGPAVGVGYTPGVCERIDPDVAIVPQRCSYGYSLGQMVGTMGTLDRQAKVTAHEIGHNFNAAHDDAGCNGSGRLMCSAIQGTGPLEFSAFSANQIRSHAENTIGYLAEL